MTLLRELHKGGTTLLLITHDRAVAAAAERRLEMRAGKLQKSE